MYCVYIMRATTHVSFQRWVGIRQVPILLYCQIFTQNLRRVCWANTTMDLRTNTNILLSVFVAILIRCPVFSDGKSQRASEPFNFLLGPHCFCFCVKQGFLSYQHSVKHEYPPISYEDPGLSLHQSLPNLPLF